MQFYICKGYLIITKLKKCKNKYWINKALIKYLHRALSLMDIRLMQKKKQNMRMVYHTNFGSDCGKKLFVKTDFSGLISGVSYTAEGPVLMVGQQSIKLKDVKKIEDPNLKQKDQNSAPAAAQDLKTPPPVAETEDKGAEEAPPSPSNLMTGVGMSNGMMEKFKKETSPASEASSGPVGAAKIIPETRPEVKAESTSKNLPSGGKMPGSKAAVAPVNG